VFNFSFHQSLKEQIMAKSRPAVEEQIKVAQKALEECVSKLKAEKKVEGDKFKQNPRWRQLNAEVKHLNRQLKGVERRESLATSAVSE